MKILQIIPRQRVRLYGAIVKKEVDLARKKKGTFFRAAAKERNEAKWRHSNYKGWINLRRGLSEVVMAEIKTIGDSAADEEWKILHAFLGFLDRHFGDQIVAINIQYR
jgi:hypothetical protein